MVNPAWGKKRVCPGCSVRYYDLKNPVPTCPKCGTPIDVHTAEHGKRRSFGGISSADIDALDRLDFDESDDATAALDAEVLSEDRYDNDLPSVGEEDIDAL